MNAINCVLKGNPDSVSNFKKLRDCRLTKSKHLSTTIKVEDNDDRGITISHSNIHSITCTSNGRTENEDKANQTDDLGLRDMVEREVQEQMCNYSLGVGDDKCIFDKQLNHMLGQLERENEELKKMALGLAVELEEKSKALKRPASDHDVACHPITSKKSTTLPSAPPLSSSQLSSANSIGCRPANCYGSSESAQKSRVATPQSPPQPPQPPPPLLPSSLAKPPKPVVLSKRSSSLLTPTPMQAIARYPHRHQHRYIIQDANNVQQMKGTHIVNAKPVLP